MRFWLSVVLLLALAIGLALFPAVASQMMMVEVMGWHLEMKQGVFLALLLLLIAVIKLLLWVIRMVLKGPEHLLAAWRSGGRRRQEVKLRRALTAWVNGESVTKGAFATVLLPNWLGDALAAFMQSDHTPEDSASPLAVAMRGRRLCGSSECDSSERGSSEPLAQRREAADQWRSAFPRSAMARQCALQLAEEAEDWVMVIDIIDQTPRGGVVADRQQRKAKALLQLAKSEPSKALEWLRQAVKIVDDDAIVIALAAAHRDGGDLKSARTVLLDGLDKHDSLPIARALAAQEAALDNPLLTLHMLDKRCRKQAFVAQRWLLVVLSQQAEDRERIQHHLRLLKQMPNGNALAWEIEAQLHMDGCEWESAARCYQQTFVQNT